MPTVAFEFWFVVSVTGYFIISLLSVDQYYFAGCTHLVTSTVHSKKYQAAVGKGVPVMVAEWVREVWRVSSTETAATALEPR